MLFAILNRLGNLVSPSVGSSCQQSAYNSTSSHVVMNLQNKNTKFSQLLIELMQNSNADRGFIASVLRSSGLEGEKILLEFMSQASNNERIMLPIVSVLPWRAKPEPVLRIKVIEYSLGSNFLPGTLYQY